MSRRIGFLSISLLVVSGVLAWSIQASFLAAQVPGVKPVEVEEVPKSLPPAAQGIPAPPVHRKEGVFDLHSLNENEDKIRKALSDPVEIEFIDTPLTDALDFISNAHDIPIVLDMQAITEEGIANDEPLTRTLSKIKLSSALKIMLEPLGLASMLEDEVLKITTLAVADAKRTTRVYHTGYLKQIGIEPDALSKTIQGVIQPEQWRRNASSTEVAVAREDLGAFGGDLHGSFGEKPAVISRDEEGTLHVVDVQTGQPAFRLRPVTMQNAAKGGGNVSRPNFLNSIEVLGDMLVVSAPASVHDEIQALLLQLDRRWETEHGPK